MENLYCSFVEFMHRLADANAMPEASRGALTPALAPATMPSVFLATRSWNQLRAHTAGLGEVAQLDW